MPGNFKKVYVVALLLAAVSVQAQPKTPYKWMVGINAGVMIYQGDLTPSDFGSYKTPSATFGIHVSRILNPYFAIRAGLIFGRFRGDDSAYADPSWRRHRNLMFSSPVSELSAQVVWNPFGNNSNELGQRITPYLFAGAGFSNLNIKRDFSRFDTTVFNYKTSQFTGLGVDTARQPPGSVFVMPVGAGLSFYLSPKFSLTLETTFRYTFNDYIDGFSYAGNPKTNDYYHTNTIGLVYRFGKTDPYECPKMKF